MRVAPCLSCGGFRSSDVALSARFIIHLRQSSSTGLPSGRRFLRWMRQCIGRFRCGRCLLLAMPSCTSVNMVVDMIVALIQGSSLSTAALPLRTAALPRPWPDWPPRVLPPTCWLAPPGKHCYHQSQTGQSHPVVVVVVVGSAAWGGCRCSHVWPPAPVPRPSTLGGSSSDRATHAVLSTGHLWHRGSRGACGHAGMPCCRTGGAKGGMESRQ